MSAAWNECPECAHHPALELKPNQVATGAGEQGVVIVDVYECPNCSRWWNATTIHAKHAAVCEARRERAAALDTAKRNQAEEIRQ